MSSLLLMIQNFGLYTFTGHSSISLNMFSSMHKSRNNLDIFQIEEIKAMLAKLNSQLCAINSSHRMTLHVITNQCCYSSLLCTMYAESWHTCKWQVYISRPTATAVGDVWRLTCQESWHTLQLTRWDRNKWSRLAITSTHLKLSIFFYLLNCVCTYTYAYPARLPTAGWYFVLQVKDLLKMFIIHCHFTMVSSYVKKRNLSFHLWYYGETCV